MSRLSSPSIVLGVGIYSRADAARLLRMEPGRLRRWVSGYTYWVDSPKVGLTRRRQPPVVQGDLPSIDSVVALSFLELMELRMVKALIESGLSLQHVRAAASLAKRQFATHHPFASRRVFTDGKAIFSAVTPEAGAPDLVKWRPGEIEQVISGPIFDQFVSEIEFDSRTALAVRWWPCGRTTPIVLDPRIAFGAPVIEDTGIRTSTIYRYSQHTTVKEAAISFEVDRRQVEAASEFERALAAA